MCPLGHTRLDDGDTRWSSSTTCPGSCSSPARAEWARPRVACASAVRLADAGERVLLVSTDPASNVGQVFGLTIGNTITADRRRCRGCPPWRSTPRPAADAYRERIIGPLRGTLPDTEIDAIREQLSGSCTTEIASFDEFTDC